MLEVSGITVELDGRPVLSDLSLSVGRNDIVAVSGESGSGKSTFIKTLFGLHRPRTGTIVINGKTLTAENLASIRALLFYLPQDILPIGDETVREFLAMPFQLQVNKTRTFDDNRAKALLDALRLKSHLWETRLQNLSGGERKRVGLVQALLLRRPLLLLDELTSSVDERNRDALVDMVLGLEETTVIGVTHDVAFMGRASRHVVLWHGRITEGKDMTNGRG